MKFIACRHCGTVTTQAVCERCAGPERAAKERGRDRPSRQARGYDADYDAARRAVALRLAGGPAPASGAARRRPARQGASQAVRRSQAASRSNRPERDEPGHTAQTGANRDGSGETGVNRGESDIPCVICGMPISLVRAGLLSTSRRYATAGRTSLPTLGQLIRPATTDGAGALADLLRL